MDQHDLIAALKQMAMDLGRTPTRAEFESKVRGGKYRVEQLFRNYTIFLQAAGLDPVKPNQRRIDNSIFERDIEVFLEENKKKDSLVPTQSPVESGVVPTMAWISDIHFPFENQKVLDAFYRYIEKEKPEVVGLAGDAWDMYSHTKFPRSHNVFRPKEEMALARQKNEDMWVEVKKANSKAQCYQLLGNHDIRPLKRVLESYPEAEDWIAHMLREAFTFEGVKTIYDPREELFFGNVMVHHGYRSKLGDHRDYAMHNAIVGHTHMAGVVYRRIRGQVLYEMNCGLAGDASAKGLSYSSQKISNWTNSFGVIDRYGPRVIIVD